MDWLDLLAVQGTLKSLLQHHSSKASVLQCSAFFIVQLSHPYVTTGKTIALTRRTFASKVMSLLFNMLSRVVIAFLPRSKHLLISWLQSQSAVILEPKKIQSVTISIVSPSICHEVIRSPLYFQSNQILQFLICVFKNLMVTSRAFIHIYRRHSHDKESLSGRWPLRQAAKRVTSSLRGVPGARAASHFQTCSFNF